MVCFSYLANVINRKQKFKFVNFELRKDKTLKRKNGELLCTSVKYTINKITENKAKHIVIFLFHTYSLFLNCVYFRNV